MYRNFDHFEGQAALNIYDYGTILAYTEGEWKAANAVPRLNNNNDNMMMNSGGCIESADHSSTILTPENEHALTMMGHFGAAEDGMNASKHDMGEGGPKTRN